MISAIFILTALALSSLGWFFIAKLWYLTPVYLLGGVIAALILLVLFLIIIMPIMKVTKPDIRFKYFLTNGLARFCNMFALGMNIEVIGKENIPKEGKLTVYANHKSKADPFVIMSQFPRSLAFTPKISLYKIPIISNYMHYIGCLPIDRDDNRRTARTMIQAVKNVEDGLAMIIFPEGGIISRDDEKMVAMKGGAYKIGMKAESDFLPISLIGMSQMYNRKWWQRVNIKMIVHPVIKYEDVKDLSSNELGDMVFEIVNSVI